MEKSLINTVHTSDHLESLLSLADSPVNWHCHHSAEDWILTQPVITDISAAGVRQPRR
jgi:hypothetical protein